MKIHIYIYICCFPLFSLLSVILYLFYFHALSFFLSFPLPHSLIQMLLGMFPGVSMWHMRSVTDVSFVFVCMRVNTCVWIFVCVCVGVCVCAHVCVSLCACLSVTLCL